MRRKDKTQSVDHALFGDEETAALRAEVESLRALVIELSQQVQSQFTSIAAHAEIARQQAEFIRQEARADLDRTRETLVGLVETVRRELVGAPAGGHETGSAAWAAPSVVSSKRFADLELRFETMALQVERCFERQQELAASMEAMLDTLVFEARNEPVLRLA